MTTDRRAIEVVLKASDVQWSADGLSGTVPEPVFSWHPPVPWPTGEAKVIVVWRGTFTSPPSGLADDPVTVSISLPSSMPTWLAWHELAECPRMVCSFDYSKPRLPFRISRPFGYGLPCPADHVEPSTIKTLANSSVASLS